MSATSDVTVDRGNSRKIANVPGAGKKPGQSPRTAAATAARRLAKAEKLCGELVARLDTLPDPMLGALVACVMAECQRRRGAAPEAAPATTATDASVAGSGTRQSPAPPVEPG